MNKLKEYLNICWHFIRRIATSTFAIFIVVSFTLWYINKLSYTYTTDFDVNINVEGEKFSVPCVVEGKGTNLIGYSIYTSRRVNIDLKELKYQRIREKVEPTKEGEKASYVTKLQIRPASLQSAISVHFSDIKVISVGAIPLINVPQND